MAPALQVAIPLLYAAMVPLVCCYAMSGTLSTVCCYAMSGTDTTCAAIVPVVCGYAMSGTDTPYDAISLLYGALRCLVLTYRMLLSPYSMLRWCRLYAARVPIV
eukprot:1581200-Rhodomonas_salina.1